VETASSGLAAFTDAREKLPRGLGTPRTRERWLLILFEELGYGRSVQHARWSSKARAMPCRTLGRARADPLGGRRVPPRSWSQGMSPARLVSPHGLVQERSTFGRRDSGHSSAGLTTPRLRDNSRRPDRLDRVRLASMMRGAFTRLRCSLVVCHESRLEGDMQHECWLERWSRKRSSGDSALDCLRAGVDGGDLCTRERLPLKSANYVADGRYPTGGARRTGLLQRAFAARYRWIYWRRGSRTPGDPGATRVGRPSATTLFYSTNACGGSAKNVGAPPSIGSHTRPAPCDGKLVTTAVPRAWSTLAGHYLGRPKTMP